MSTETTVPPSPTETKKANAKLEVSAIPLSSDQGAEEQAIRPFEFHATDKDLADLKRRISATKWPAKETVGRERTLAGEKPRF